MNNNTQGDESIIQLLHSDDVDDVALGIIIAVRLYGRKWFLNMAENDPLPADTIMTKSSQAIAHGGIAVVFPDGEYIYAYDFFEYVSREHREFNYYMNYAEYKYEYGE